MRKIIIALAAAMLAGCGGDIGNARDAVKAKLNDPGSAEFRGDTVYEVDGSTIVCGEVNARNRMGGYAGFEPYIVRAGIATIGDSAQIDCEFAEMNSSLRK